MNKIKSSWLIVLSLVFMSGCGDSTVTMGNNEAVLSQGVVSTNGLKNSRAFDFESVDVVRRDGLLYLNNLRSSAGMISFNPDFHLDNAALSHASYLVSNNTFGHYESKKTRGFTGITPWERAVAHGYPHYQVSENVSGGNNNVKDSIDGLFSAIYHRFGFLDFSFDEIGIGKATSSRYAYTNAYNYDMGINGISEICTSNSALNSYSYYTKVCADVTRKVDQEAFSMVMEYNKNLNPKVVVWPYDGQQDSRTVFYEESPDPLPECGVSGYPISIQFNDIKNDSIDMNSFRLFNATTNQEITNTKFMDKRRDPNQRFTDKQFALFPMERLDWNTNYRVEVEYNENGIYQKLDWSFKTKSLPYQYFVVNNINQSFNVARGGTYLFYLKPSNCNDVLREATASGLAVGIGFYDTNTIQLTIPNKRGDILVTPSNGRNFTVHAR